MPTLAVWFIWGPGHHHDPILVRSVKELDAVLTMVIAVGSSDNEVDDGTGGALIEMTVADCAVSPTLEIGLGARRGFVRYQSIDEQGWTVGDAGSTGVSRYPYPGGIREVPAAVEVEIGVVRDCAREFLRTGRKPSAVRTTEP